jgi:RNA polymerase sigma-70 factor (ECF subfamily)
LAQRVDPDDIVQSVFRTFFRRIAHGGYDVPAGGELWRLFLVIALNKIRSLATFHRAAKRDVRLAEGGDAFDRALDTLAQPDQSALDVLRLIIDEILNSLPAVQRQMNTRCPKSHSGRADPNELSNACCSNSASGCKRKWLSRVNDRAEN